MRGTWIALFVALAASSFAVPARAQDDTKRYVAVSADPPRELEGGLDAAIGFAHGGGMAGRVYGGAFRVGWQVSRRFTIYGQTEIMGWDGELEAGQTTARGGLTWRHIALGTYSPARWLEFGLGPAIDATRTLSTSDLLVLVSGPQHYPITYGGIYFGFHEHLSVRLPFGRRGPSLVADVHSMTGSGRLATTYATGIGYEWF